MLEALPDHFTPSTHDEIRRDLPNHPSWVAVEDDEILGFVLAPRRYAAGAEITFAGVAPAHHGQGIGKALVEECLATLAAVGATMVEVKTLDASAGYEPYVATRGLWERPRVRPSRLHRSAARLGARQPGCHLRQIDRLKATNHAPRSLPPT